jgi:dihydroorotate dehydrogenase electron transfer subunit
LTAPLGRRLVDVSGRRALGSYFVLSCVDDEGPAPEPGQFYMLAAAERWGGGEDERPFLPRAFSVARASGDGTLDFMLEDVGPGTRRLAELRAGDGLWLLGPLGNRFTVSRRRPVLVGGGVGTAPLVMLADTLDDPVVLLGFRDAEHAEGAALIDGARVATDDGSVGHHGLVTELLRAELREADEVFACGPPPMLEAVRALCEELDVPAQLALESGMACGFGACFGCVVETKNGYVRLCVDGPVLEASCLTSVASH